MVELWLDPESNAQALEAETMHLLHETQGTIDPENVDELLLDIDEEVDRALNQLGLDDLDLDLDVEADHVELSGDREESSSLASAPEVDDWRRLQKMTEKPSQQDSEEALQEEHPWFKSRRLAAGNNLLPYRAAGSDPLYNVLGMTVEAPDDGEEDTQYSFFPGELIDVAKLNPQRFGDESKPKFRRHSRPGFDGNRLIRKRHCPFSKGNLPMPDLKNVSVISRFVSEGGKILPKRRTGITSKNQRKFARIVKRARNFGLIPTTSRMQRPDINLQN
jgi:small subunit ribosomal protein S18